ncbi:neuromedin-U isoform X3 [Hyperolius riggenbachi]|uniref:neuromedin-U isoform X3 n=1 Tax=Hyperolius riggenbachi TaxID=752182 RepID=UPI0035A3497A
MLSSSNCQRQLAMQKNSEEGAHSRHQLCNFRWQPPYGLLLILIMLASWTGICQGAPFSSHVLQAEQELQLWDGISDACSAVLSDSQPVVSSTLEELCFMVMGMLQKSQGLEDKEESKRSSVLHPLLQIVPQLHDRRMKRFEPDQEVQGPGGVLSRGYFLFRPRNGRRSSGFR